MRELYPTLIRNKRLIGLFALMVLAPAFVFSLLIVRAIRHEEVRLAYETIERQHQVVRLAERELNAWLFSDATDSGRSLATLRFEIADDRIVFPDFQLAMPAAGMPRVRPFEPLPSTEALTTDVVAAQYYPRIQSFLRDGGNGRHIGAQHFLRLKALIVRPPGTDRGYVVRVENVLAHVNTKLAELCANEPFTATVSVADADRKPLSTTAAVTHALQNYPFFELAFADATIGSGINFQRYAFAYAMTLLVAVTVLGSVFVHRALSHDVRLSHLRSQFVAAVSHEFRSPLTSIRVLAERLVAQRTISPEQLAEYHRIIEHDARRLSVLVDRLLEFARIEERKANYSRATTDLASVTREAIEAIGHIAGVNRLRLTAPDDGPLWVSADRTALSHAIQNLIENAAKYSAIDAPIDIICASNNGSHFVEVRDRGIGIPPGEEERIFEKFYRGGNVAGLSVQGVGIGLALVKHVMDEHGGSVSVESHPGEGSRFTLHLPRVES